MPRKTELTKRELDVLTLLAEGLNQTNVKEQLGISQSRVTTIVDQLRNKLGLPYNATRADIVRAARAAGHIN